MARLESIVEVIGGTPAVRVNRLAPPGVNLYAKLEAQNPMGSIKDRLALGVIEDAERRGDLKPGGTVVEATSGNTGIGLAMVCAAKGYSLVVTMAENFSVERRKIMRFLGAKVVLTPASQKGSGMMAKAAELAQAHGWFNSRQFENQANADMHSRTTAREILADFEGVRLDYFVTGFGTGGTLKGVGRVLREHRPETKIVVCEPDNSPILGSGVAQAKLPDGTPAASHPAFRPHLIQGWSPDFVPRLVEEAQGLGLIDQLVMINSGEALRLSRELARSNGIFTGISGGATLGAALEVCRAAAPGSTVLCMLPDTGERYLSTPLFADVPVEMTDDELEISRSTPGCRFDLPANPAPSTPPAAPVSEPATARSLDEARAFVERVTADPAQPLVMFAFEWCEFCWSVRKLFARCKIPYRPIDLDTGEYQQDNLGTAIREALTQRTSMATIPQIFIAGELVGGCTEVFDAYTDGRLGEMLARAGVPFERDPSLDPYTLLPSWLHPRTTAEPAPACDLKPRRT
jgi:cysteine synthase A